MNNNITINSFNNPIRFKQGEFNIMVQLDQKKQKLSIDLDQNFYLNDISITEENLKIDSNLITWLKLISKQELQIKESIKGYFLYIGNIKKNRHKKITWTFRNIETLEKYASVKIV